MEQTSKSSKYCWIVMTTFINKYHTQRETNFLFVNFYNRQLKYDNEPTTPKRNKSPVVHTHISTNTAFPP